MNPRSSEDTETSRDLFKAALALIYTFLTHTASIATSQALPVDYENAEGFGNSINSKDNVYPQLHTASDEYDEYNDVHKREPEIFLGSSQKRNIISALRSKMRRSKPADIEDKLRFSPVLSVGKFVDDFTLFQKSTQILFRELSLPDPQFHTQSV